MASFKWPPQQGSGGTVTSVSLSLPSSLFSVSGSPVTGSGTLTGTLLSQSANQVFASPNGSSGVPSFRALVSADIPVLPYLSTTLGTANGLSVAGNTLSLGLSSTSTTGALSSTDWNTFNGKQAAGNYITALTGDATATGPGSVPLTLATVNGNVGSFGSSTSIPSFTVNAKGLITAASGNAVIAPAGTLTGTTLASNVVSSSLTSVGTITSGTWNGSVITPPFGGSPPVTRVLYVDNGRTDSFTADGSFARPFATIGAAVSKVISNADNATYPYSIFVYPGTYTETVTLNNSLLYNLNFFGVGSAESGSGPAVSIAGTPSISSTSNNTQLANLVFSGFTLGNGVTLTGDVNNTNFGSTEILFNGNDFEIGGGNLTFTNVNNINIYGGQVNGSNTITFNNIAFGYIEGAEGLHSNETLTLIQNNAGNQPSQSTGNYLLLSTTKIGATVSIDAGSELDAIQTYFSSTSSITNNGILHSFHSSFNGSLTLNNGSSTRFRGDVLLNAPTVNAGATVVKQGIGEFAALSLYGSTASATIQSLATTINYNFNLPATAGTSGQPLLSGGGGATSMTFGTLSVGGGGTGQSSLTANNVILGNGTSPVQFVAPGAARNRLVSNGTTWVQAPPLAGVSMTLSADQTGLATDTNQLITYNQVTTDPNSIADTTNHQVVIAVAGYYLIHNNIMVEASVVNTLTRAISYIYINGVQSYAIDNAFATATATNCNINCSIFIHLNVNDTVQGWARGSVSSGTWGVGATTGTGNVTASNLTVTQIQ